MDAPEVVPGSCDVSVEHGQILDRVVLPTGLHALGVSVVNILDLAASTSAKAMSEAWQDIASCHEVKELFGHDLGLIAELICNVYQHAAAQVEGEVRWRARMSRMGPRVVAVVEDNGKGIDLSEICKRIGNDSIVGRRVAISEDERHGMSRRSHRGLGLESIALAVKEGRLCRFEIKSGWTKFSFDGSTSKFESLRRQHVGTAVLLQRSAAGAR